MFEEIVPNYDQEQVYNSDIKKVFQWYNILFDTDNLIKEESKEEKKESSGDAGKKKEDSKEETKKEEKKKISLTFLHQIQLMLVLLLINFKNE